MYIPQSRKRGDTSPGLMCQRKCFIYFLYPSEPNSTNVNAVVKTKIAAFLVVTLVVW
jgi:hypothetical protein